MTDRTPTRPTDSRPPAVSAYRRRQHDAARAMYGDGRSVNEPAATLERKEVKYQHTIPMALDDPDYHEEEPKPTGVKNRSGVRVTYTCRYCNRQLIPVKDNEGPESLKSMLRF